MLNLHSFWVEPVYRQCCNEDGRYDVCVGYQVMARETIEGGVRYWSHEGVVPGLEANDFRAKCEADPSIVVDSEWESVGEDTRTWQDIEQEWNELAYRERAGLPL